MDNEGSFNLVVLVDEADSDDDRDDSTELNVERVASRIRLTGLV